MNNDLTVIFVESKWWKEELMIWEIAATFNFWINNKDLTVHYEKWMKEQVKTRSLPSHLFEPIFLN